MMIGYIRIDNERGTINTHRDSYLLDTITVASVRRPFLSAGILCGGGLTGFALAFGDLLYMREIIVVLAGAALAAGSGWQVGQLKLLSRDLRGSELADMIWGQYAALNNVRRQIADAVAFQRNGRKA